MSSEEKDVHNECLLTALFENHKAKIQQNISTINTYKKTQSRNFTTEYDKAFSTDSSIPRGIKKKWKHTRARTKDIRAYLQIRQIKCF